MPKVPALYKAPGVPQRVPGFLEALGPVTLKGAAHSWSMSYAPEAPPAGDAEPDMRLLPPAGLHDPAEGVAFALWNEGRKDEAIEFLERRIARERETGGGRIVPPRGRAAFRLVGAGAFAVVLLAAGAALWGNWNDAAGFLGRVATVRSPVDAEAREAFLSGADEEDIQSAPDLAEVTPAQGEGIGERAAQNTESNPAHASADVREIRLGEPASQVSPVPMQDSTIAAETEPQPEADVVEALTAATEVEPEADAEFRQGSAIHAEPKPEAGALLAESSAAVAEPEPEAGAEVAQASTDAPPPERQAPLDHLRIVAALQAGAQMAAAEVETQSASPAEAAPVDPESGPHAVVPQRAELAQPVREARLPRSRPESAPAIAEAPARRAVVAAADNPPFVEASPPVVTLHPDPYPPLILEPAPLPPELAYNRARAERYLAMRRAVAERRATERVYLVPPPQYGGLEIIGRVPGW